MGTCESEGGNEREALIRDSRRGMKEEAGGSRRSTQTMLRTFVMARMSGYYTIALGIAHLVDPHFLKKTCQSSLPFNLLRKPIDRL